MWLKSQPHSLLPFPGHPSSQAPGIRRSSLHGHPSNAFWGHYGHTEESAISCPWGTYLTHQNGANQNAQSNFINTWVSGPWPKNLCFLKPLLWFWGPAGFTGHWTAGKPGFETCLRGDLPSLGLLPPYLHKECLDQIPWGPFQLCKGRSPVQKGKVRGFERVPVRRTSPQRVRADEERTNDGPPGQASQENIPADERSHLLPLFLEQVLLPCRTQ